MTSTTTILNLEAFKNAPLNADPFPYLIVPNFLRHENLAEVLRDYPDIHYPGSVPLNQLTYGAGFQKFIDELEGNALREAVAEKFSIDLKDRPTLITLRGKTRRHDGQIHTDTKSKLITLLLYMNPIWENVEGRLRLLRNGRDIENYVTEVSPELGTCLFFKVTDNCWHGHKRFIGVRKSIQLNYVTDVSAANHYISRHGFSAKWKRLKQWFKA